MKKLVIFASGSGSNFQAIINTIEKNEIEAGIAGLITDRTGIGAIEIAHANQIETVALPPEPADEYISGLHENLTKWKPDLIVLAGYLRKIPSDIVRRYPNKIINIHPALLPDYGGRGFYGMNVHRAVIEAGEKESGCTVHFVNEEYDRGAIIRQERVPVLPEDTPETLAKRVLQAEHQVLPLVIKTLLTQ